MKKILKTTVAALLVIAVLMGLAMHVGAEEALDYKAGDIIEFGMYPQSAVTDETVLSRLNAQTLEWVSYGYYSGNGSYGSATASDYMKYADVELDGKRYRAVKFTEYRPWQSECDPKNSNLEQQNNGYKTETVYWFSFEPIKWKVLDPATGLVLCESILDSQPFQNEVYYNSSEFMFTAHYADDKFTIPANTYSASSLKAWLENYFTQTAFSQDESEFITQNAHLLSWADSCNKDYGFNSSKEIQDTARMRAGSDYAKAQGLLVNVNNPGSGNSYWWLEGSITIYQYVAAAEYSGTANRAIGVSCTYIGVCPAINLDLSEVEYSVVLNNYDSTETLEYKYGEPLAGIPTPKREGYTFIGWDAVIPETMPAKSLEFKALWEINSYNVIWNIDGNKTTESYDYGEKLASPKAPEKEGYTFIGWDAEVPETMPAKNLEFKALWEINSNVSAAEDKISKLPDTVTKDDAAKVKAAEDAYNALSDYEKSLIEKDTKAKLEKAVKALAEIYKVIDTTVPATGDTSTLWLWFALALVSGSIILALVVCGRKKKSVQK